MKRLLPWLIGIALAVVAGALTIATPETTALNAPFVAKTSYAPADEGASVVTTRTLTASVVDASFADRIEDEDADWTAGGNWLVLTIAASAPRDEADSVIELASLRIGDQVFHASERPRDTLQDERLHIGIDTVGMLAFELPEGLRQGDAVLRLGPEYLTPRLDDVIEVSVPLAELPTASVIGITPPEVSP